MEVYRMGKVTIVRNCGVKIVDKKPDPETSTSVNIVALPGMYSYVCKKCRKVIATFRREGAEDKKICSACEMRELKSFTMMHRARDGLEVFSGIKHEERKQAEGEEKKEEPEDKLTSEQRKARIKILGVTI